MITNVRSLARCRAQFFPLLIALLLTLASLFHSGSGMVHTSYWKLDVPAWASDYRVPKMWGAPFGVLTDNPFAGSYKRLDVRDSFDFPNFAANFLVWLAVASPAVAVLRGFRHQLQREREYSRSEKTPL